MARRIVPLAPALVAFLLVPAASSAQEPVPVSASGAPHALAAALAPIPSGARLRVAAAGRRFEFRRGALRGDTIALSGAGGPELAIGVVDSVWVRRGTLAPWFGWTAAAACGTFAGGFGLFLGSDPDSGGSGGGEAVGLGLLLGMLGGAACGVPAAAVGSLIPRWRLLWGRPRT